MPMFTVRLFSTGSRPLQTEELAVSNAAEAREWANRQLRDNQTFSRAQIYADEILLSEIGYRINRPD